MRPSQILLLVIILGAGICFAQFRARPERNSRPDGSGHFVRIEGGLVLNENEVHTARETATHSSGTPEWTNAPGFEEDVFTFTRVIFQNNPAPRSGGGRGRFRWLGW